MTDQSFSRNPVLVVLLIIIALSVLYYFVIYLPQQKEEKHKEEVAKIQDLKGWRSWEIENDYNNCKLDADISYLKQWRIEEEVRGLPPHSSLPILLAESLEKNRGQAFERCMNEYKIKLETLEKEYPGIPAIKK